MATENKLPKGPSNSAGMGATPGTQQTAINNVVTGGFNPNMPIAPQAAKQGASSFQKSLMTPPKPSKPATTKRMQQVAPAPIVSSGMPMDMGRGYNIFSGMDASQINQMNQSMGLSNMTALPSLVKEKVSPKFKPTVDIDKTRSTMGEPQTMFLMSGEADQGDSSNNTLSQGAVSYEYDPETGLVQTSIDGYPVGEPQEPDDVYAENLPELESWLSEKPNYTGDKGEAKAQEYEDMAEQFYEDAANVEIEVGFPAEEYESLKSEYEQNYKGAKESLDEKYAIQLQQMLAGIDRQMAMAGMFGSGAHSLNINNAVAQGLATMASEYADLDARLADNLADLDLQNMQQIEQDVLNLLESKLKLGDKFKALAETITTDEDEEMIDYVEQKNLTTTIIDSVTSEVEAYASDIAGGVAAGTIAQGLNFLEDIYTQKLLDAKTPQELQILESELESYVTDFFALLNMYDKLRNKGDTDSLTTFEKRERAKQLNEMYGQILTDMGFLSSPGAIIAYPSLMFTI